MCIKNIVSIYKFMYYQFHVYSILKRNKNFIRVMERVCFPIFKIKIVSSIYVNNIELITS